MTERTPAFPEDLVNSPTAFFSVLGGAIVGCAGGILLDGAIQHTAETSDTQNSIDTLQKQQAAIHQLEDTAGAKNNQTVQEFLQSQSAVNATEIHALQSTPHETNMGESTSIGLGGAVVGMITAAACVAQAKRTLRNRRNRKATTETIVT